MEAPTRAEGLRGGSAHAFVRCCVTYAPMILLCEIGRMRGSRPMEQIMPIESFCSGTAAIVVFLIASSERRMSATALTVLAALFLVCLGLKGPGVFLFGPFSRAAELERVRNGGEA